MAIIDLDPYKIIQNETGANARVKTNDSLTLLESTINGKSETTHNHNTLYAPISHTQNASTIIYTKSGSDVLLSSELDLINQKLTGLNVSAIITEIEFTGDSSVYNSVIANAVLNNNAYGSFEFEYYFDGNPTGTSFSGKIYKSNSNQYMIVKPASGYNSQNQLYLHVRASFRNLQTTVLTQFVAHQLITKFVGNVSSAEIVASMNENETIIKAISLAISSNPNVLANIATQVTKTL